MTHEPNPRHHNSGKPLNLDPNTLGKSPAALYVVCLLNKSGNHGLARKVGKILRVTREVINDIKAAHYQTDEIKTATFNRIIAWAERDARENCAKLSDPFIGQLCVNILVGELRTHKRRSGAAAVLQQKVARATPSGSTVPMVKALPRMGEETEDARIRRLQKKSSEYLARRGKINTLY